MIRTIKFKSETDGQEFEIRVPETSGDIENAEFVKINDKNYKGGFYEFNWDTASGCVFSRLKKWDDENEPD